MASGGDFHLVIDNSGRRRKVSSKRLDYALRRRARAVTTAAARIPNSGFGRWSQWRAIARVDPPPRRRAVAAPPRRRTVAAPRVASCTTTRPFGFPGGGPRETDCHAPARAHPDLGPAGDTRPGRLRVSGWQVPLPVQEP